MSIRIMGTGSYLPERLMTNQDFEKYIDTTDEWIVTRTGIKRRHFTDGQWNVDFCEIAAQRAMENAGITKEQLGGIIVATVTNEMGVPSVAAQLQRRLEIPSCIAFDVNAACTGFMYALKVASCMIGEKPFLVIGSETLSRFMNFEDRASCILFGDGAGAVVITRGDQMKYFEIESQPDVDHTIEINGMNTKADGEHVPSYVSLKGKEVYIFATRETERVMNAAMEATNVQPSDFDWFVMHQANIRILQTISKRMGVPMEKFYSNIEDTANTSAASVPLVLDAMNRNGLLKSGQKIMMVGFGGGLTLGCAVYHW